VSNFERRLSAVGRRPATAGAPSPGGDDIAWSAAERVSRIVDVEAGTVIKLCIDAPSRQAIFEVCWDADGIAAIHEL
jgi:hypothetical protein